MTNDHDMLDLVDITERWLRDVRIKAMWEAFSLVGIKYKRKVELLCDRYYLSESALNQIVRTRHPIDQADNGSTVNKEKPSS